MRIVEHTTLGGNVKGPIPLTIQVLLERLSISTTFMVNRDQMYKSATQPRPGKASLPVT